MSACISGGNVEGMLKERYSIEFTVPIR
jgi:hypothetical protein